MRPTLFHIFHYPVHAYPTMLSIAFITGTLLCVRICEKRGLWVAPDAGLWVFVGALIGAKAFYIIQYNPYAPTLGPAWHRHVWRAILIWQGGVVYYGGLIGGIIAVILYLYWYRIPRIQAMDVMAVFLPMGQAITRVGCFLNGCCYGYPTDVRWAVRFPRGSHAYLRQLHNHQITEDAPCSLPVHPTELYMCGGLIIIFLILLYMLKRQRFHSQLILSYMVLYGLLRFIVEFYRGESARSVYGLTVSQTISAVLLLAGLAGWFIAWKRGLWKHPVLTFPAEFPGNTDAGEEPNSPSA